LRALIPRDLGLQRGALVRSWDAMTTAVMAAPIRW